MLLQGRVFHKGLLHMEEYKFYNVQKTWKRKKKIQVDNDLRNGVYLSKYLDNQIE